MPVGKLNIKRGREANEAPVVPYTSCDMVKTNSMPLKMLQYCLIKHVPVSTMK